MKKLIFIALSVTSISIPAFSAAPTVVTTLPPAVVTKQPSAAAANPAGHLVTSKSSDLSLVLPDKWEVMEQNLGIDLVALAPVFKPDDLFRQNLNVISVKFKDDMSLEDYFNINKESLRELLEDFNLESAQDATIGGIPAKKLIFTHTVGPVNVKVIQYLALVGNKAFVITFTADTLDFDKISQDFDKIASSIQFKPVDMAKTEESTPKS